MILLKVYNTKNKPQLRAKIKVNGKVMSVWCGKSLNFLSPLASVSVVDNTDPQDPFIEIKHESGVVHLKQASK